MASNLKEVARDLCDMVKALDLMDGQAGDKSRQRSIKAKALIKAAYVAKFQERYTGVAFTVKKAQDGQMMAQLMSINSGSEVARYATIKEGGWHACSCPDHKKGFMCKHLRALAGAAALWVE